MFLLRVTLAVLAFPFVASAAQAQAGLLNRVTRLPPITLSAGKPLADARRLGSLIDRDCFLSAGDA